MKSTTSCCDTAERGLEVGDGAAPDMAVGVAAVAVAVAKAVAAVAAVVAAKKAAVSQTLRDCMLLCGFPDFNFVSVLGSIWGLGCKIKMLSAQAVFKHCLFW